MVKRRLEAGRPAISCLPMSERRALRGLPLAGMAVAGVVLGHWLAYAFAVPEPHVRDQILAASGHSYWVLAVKTAVLLGLTSLGSVLVRHLSGRVRGVQPAGERLSWLAVRLGIIQVVAFTAMEITERLFAHVAVGHMLQHHLFLLGLAVQVALAWVGAFVLLLFGRAAARISQALAGRSFPRVAVAVSFPSATASRSAGALAGAAGLRGPPSS
jgi:hypothetical protein